MGEAPDRAADLSRPAYDTAQRLVDLLIALPLLLLAIPVMLALAIAVRLDSSGPALFRQERLGRAGRRFVMWKLRSMTAGISTEGDDLFIQRGDARITRVGRFLRATSLDELPQLVNVVRGQMSLVGPRPPVPWWPYEYDDYPPAAKVRFVVRPGITGYSQVIARNDASWDERLRHDAWYVEHRSLRLYAWILWRTCFKVASREGIERPAPTAGPERSTGE